MLTFKNVTLAQGTKMLYQNANLLCAGGMRIGLVGRNGCGKTSMFSAILGKIDLSSGDILLKNNVKISYIEQETTSLDICALDFILEGDSELHAINQELKAAEEQENHEKVVELHTKIYDIDGYNASTRAEKLLAGLGFTEDEMLEPVRSFSGGWRMRLNIAKCLMERSDLLLLDEPTNHLDLETVYWLEKWLLKYTGCIIVISHDREFLDRVTNKIIHIESGSVKMYTGNYSQFEQLRSEIIRAQNAMFEKQQTKIEHMMHYVNRFRAKASKAKQAQSRLKAIDKLEKISKAQIDSPFYFNFFEPADQPSPLVKLYKANLGYGKDIIVDKASLSIEPGARIGLLGKNGAGKSTLIKTITKKIPLLGGELNVHSKSKIGYFHQHVIDYLPLDKTPLEIFSTLKRKDKSSNIRSYLGGFNFSGDTVNQKINNFSGGEKARLALACIVFESPNLLLLDEPTNHLDIEMRESLVMALQSYTGAVVIVSHDRHMLETTVDKIFYIKNRKLHEFRDSIQEYLATEA